MEATKYDVQIATINLVRQLGLAAIGGLVIIWLGGYAKDAYVAAITKPDSWSGTVLGLGGTVVSLLSPVGLSYYNFKYIRRFTETHIAAQIGRESELDPGRKSSGLASDGTDPPGGTLP